MILQRNTARPLRTGSKVLMTPGSCSARLDAHSRFREKVFLAYLCGLLESGKATANLGSGP